MKRDLIPKFLDMLVTEPSFSIAGKSLGIRERTAFGWMTRSRRGDEAFQQIEFAGEVLPFHDQVRRAQAMNAALFEQGARSMAMQGFEETVTFQGAVQYEVDPELVGMTDEELKFLGYRDHYRRDAAGRVIPLKVRRAPSSQTVIRLLASLHPEVYGEKSKIEHSGSVTLGVTRVGADGAMTHYGNSQISAGAHKTAESFLIEAPKAKPADEKLGLVVGEAAENLDEKYGGEWTDDRRGAPIFEEEGAEELPDFTRSATHAPDAPALRPVETPLQRDLRERAARLAKEGPKNPRPGGPVGKRWSPPGAPRATPPVLRSANVTAEPPEGQGAGHVVPGGMKVC
jgi:hypothetical protein